MAVKNKLNSGILTNFLILHLIMKIITDLALDSTSNETTSLKSAIRNKFTKGAWT